MGVKGRTCRSTTRHARITHGTDLCDRRQVGRGPTSHPHHANQEPSTEQKDGKLRLQTLPTTDATRQDSPQATPGHNLSDHPWLHISEPYLTRKPCEKTFIDHRALQDPRGSYRKEMRPPWTQRQEHPEPEEQGL